MRPPPAFLHPQFSLLTPIHSSDFFLLVPRLADFSIDALNPLAVTE